MIWEKCKKKNMQLGKTGIRTRNPPKNGELDFERI